jgi:hypothetical protein
VPPLLRIFLALLSLFFVVAVGLSVLLPRVCAEDAARARLPGTASSELARRIELAGSSLPIAGSNGAAAGEKAL